MHTKLWGPKVAGLPFGSPGTKCYLDVRLVDRHIIYYKGEGGGFPQVWVMVSLLSLSLLVARLNTKKTLTMH